MNENYYIYIMASTCRGTLYVGVTSDLIKRVYEHRNGLVDGFTDKYDVCMLAYYEVAGDSGAAIMREKQIKKWNRAWKIKLIEKLNPGWTDLYDSLLD